MTTPPLQAAAPKPRKLGCWFYGCTTLFVLVMLGVAGIYFGARYAFGKFRGFTSTQPLALEKVELPPTEWTNLQERIAGFAKALDEGQAQELVLSQTEVNAYIDNHPKYSEMGEWVHLLVQGEQITGQFSLPIPNEGIFKMAGVGGRYLNGQGTFDVELEEGELQVFLRDMTVNDKPLPEQFEKEFGRNNLARDIEQDAETRAALEKFESIRVEDGKVVLKSRAQAPPSTAPEP